MLVGCSMRLFGGDGRDSISKPSLSPGVIIASTVIATIVDNATIMATEESTAGAEAKALPFNFLTSGAPASAGCD